MKKQLLFLFAALLPLVASAQTKVEIDGIRYNLTSETLQAEVTSGGRYSGTIAIPATVTYEGVDYSVTSIGDEAFYDCISLTAITIPEGVTSIGDWAFDYCRNLTAITIPEGVTNIGWGAFQNCSSLTAITIPEGVASIGDWAFAYCSSLTAITVAEGNALYDSRGGCNAIIETNSNTLIAGCSTTIIPEGVTSIGEGAFSSCRSLTAITIPESVTSIGYDAFYDCSSLTTINIPEGSQLTSIGESAFYDCSSLTAIILPEGVTSIGRIAFRYCSSLTTITCKAVAPPTIEGNTFYEVDKSIPVYVPAGSIEAYKAATGWSDFTNYVGIETGIENPEIRNHKSEITFDLRGRRVEKVEKGIYIVNGKKTVIK